MSSKLVKINGGGKTYKPENYTDFIIIAPNVRKATHIKDGEIHLIKTIENLQRWPFDYYGNEMRQLTSIFNLAKELSGDKGDQPLISQRIVLQKFIKNNEDEHGSKGYIVTNFINGCTLFDLANAGFFRNRYINENRLKYIFKPILTFINMINSNEYYHNDIKADNIMITNEFNVCIIDYQMMTEGGDGGVYGCLPRFCDISSYLMLLDSEMADAMVHGNIEEMGLLLGQGSSPGRKKTSPRDLLAVAALIIYIIAGDFGGDHIVHLSDRLLEKLRGVQSNISPEFYQFLDGLIKNEINHTNVLTHTWLNESDDPECLKEVSGKLFDLERLTRVGGTIRKKKTKKKSKKVKSKKLRSKNKKYKRRKTKKR